MSLINHLIGDAVAFDELGNAVILEGNPHETISAHCGAQIVSKRECLFCKVVCGFIQTVLGRFWPHLRTHCMNAWQAEAKMVADSKGLTGT